LSKQLHTPDLVTAAARRRGVGKDLVRAAVALLVAFVVTSLAVSIVFSRGLVVGDFMAPALRDGDAIVVERASGRFIDYRAGEIVSLRMPGEPRGRLLKRVVGGPGDPVLASGTLLRTLGPDEFVVADELAVNGRTVLERDEIEGRVLLLAWPLSRLTWRPGLER
jgi:signal peptidase I